MAHNLIHGEARRNKKSKLHSVWGSMIQRCCNSNNPKYYLYGGRGIFVCDEWRSFILFREWALTSGYEDHLEIDRIDNNDGYYPANCRWTTKSENALNRSKSITWGITVSNKLWMVQITRNNIRYCVGRFKSIEEAVIGRDFFLNNFEKLKSTCKSYNLLKYPSYHYKREF